MPESPTNPLSPSVLGTPSFEPTPDRASVAVPERIGPYRILERIGEGGMGEVYKAERLEPMQQTVAIKLVRSGLASREVARRFEAERQTLALMDHPGIARVLDAGTTEAGQAYFVMDYVAGKSVTAFCDDHRLPITDRLKLFVDICDAIAHAHTKAVLHRDIKPSNVLAYLQDGKPAIKVIDFGIAKALSDKHLTDLTMHTGLGRAIGTYDCMSPEQAEGSTDVDTRSDVYSLGVLLYELLTGTKPFDPTTLLRSADAEIRRIIREVEPARPSTRLSQLGVDASALADRRQVKIETLARQLRNELEWIPLKAMRKERTRRYDSVSQLATDVQNYLDGRPLLAGPETRSYRLRKLVRRNRPPLLAASVALTAVVGGTVLYVQSIRAEQARTRAALLDAQQARAESEAQRIEAQKQAMIALDSSNFLANIFRNADPTRSLGDSVTIIQAMDEAVKKLDDGTLSVEPITEAMVRYVIGTTYRSLGRYDEAVPQLEKARALDLEHRLPSDPQVRVTLSDLANVLTQQGKLDQAEPMFREALRIDQEHHPDDRLSMAITKLNLATILKERKQFAEAAVLLSDALSTRRELLGEAHPDTISAMNNLAQMYWQQGRLDLAEPIVRQTLEARRAALPEGHPHIAQSMMNLGVVLRDQKKFADAEPLCREALAMRRQVLPPAHPDIAVALDNLARVVHPMGKLDEAAELFTECLMIRTDALPAGDPRIADTMYRLALVRIEQANPGEGERLLRDALALQRALNPKAAPTLLTVRTLAGLLNGAGRTTEAAELLESFGLDDESPPARALPPS
jgi:serine/threonine protein kinase